MARHSQWCEHASAGYHKIHSAFFTGLGRILLHSADISKMAGDLDFRLAETRQRPREPRVRYRMSIICVTPADANSLISWETLSQEIRLAAVAGGFLSILRLCQSQEKTATRDPAQALLPVPARSKPCMPLRARPIQPRYLPGPKRDFAATLAGRCADREYGFPLPPVPIRSRKCGLERTAAAHGHHPGRTTSRRCPSARPPARMLLPPATNM